MQINFCPHCGKPVQMTMVEYRERPVCLTAEGGCGYIHFGNYSLGAGGLVVQTGPDGQRRALLIERGEEPNKGGWTIPGGFVEFDEPVHLAVIREVEEETGLKCEMVGLVALRNRADATDNNTYAVFLLQPVSGELLIEPTPEIANAGFFTLDEMKNIARLAPLSLELASAVLEDRLKLLSAITVTGLPGRSPSTLFI